MPANPADAAKWLERAAEQGQAVAQYRLGAVYERGQGVPANPATATHWYQLAANQGNRKAMHNLAVAYRQRRRRQEGHGRGGALVRQGRGAGPGGFPVQSGGAV